MEAVCIDPSATTPKVTFVPEKGLFELSGLSYPENSVAFFLPVKKRLLEMLAMSDGPFTANFRLDYFNTSSSKSILELLEILDRHHQHYKNVKVNWLYAEDDEDMRDNGLDYRTDLTVPFEVLPESR
ncbi:MAG: DUF1987 domain-containing protein [Verrucomicrobium sp.]|nr:DUF1987 domain-containing protein [Verrucomicrobium sp.]